MSSSPEPRVSSPEQTAPRPSHWEDMAYVGKCSEYRSLPWLHELMGGCVSPRMPWKVEDVNPMGYVVLVSSNGMMFKMFNRLVVVEGDAIL